MIEHAAVYRVYDDAGALIYIGSTYSLRRRMYTHRRYLGDFMGYAHKIVIRQCDDVDLARKIEARAIRLLRPEFNVFGQRDEYERRQASYGKLPERHRPRLLDEERFAIKSEQPKHNVKDVLEGAQDRGHRETIEAILEPLSPSDRAKTLRLVRDVFGVTNPADRSEALAVLNKADKKALTIKNTMTIKRWQDDGYPGLERGRLDAHS